MDELARENVLHVASDLFDPPDPLVAEAQRIGRGILSLHEEPQLGVEPLAAERGSAPPELQLGALADSADDGARPHLGRHDRAVVVIGEAASSGPVTRSSLAQLHL